MNAHDRWVELRDGLVMAALYELPEVLDTLDLYGRALVRIGELNPQLYPDLGDGETDRPNEVDEL